MRNALPTLFLFSAIARAAPDLIAAFIEPLPETFPQDNNNTIAENGFELVKRQNNCAIGYAACSALNPGLCCRSSEVCSQDSANHVACCPLNAICTGTINPGGGVPAPTSSLPSFVTASTTTSQFGSQPTSNTGFVQSGTAFNTPSFVSNQYYPFAAIPTTYNNAAACSSAYTSCSTEAMSCSNALANGAPGVTISAPNGGVTITAIASLGAQSAGQICASLSSAACSGLVVDACARFGDGVPGRGMNLCGNMYGVGAGVAVGIAGQLLR